MSFQGRQLTVEMKQLVVNLKLSFDAERKTSREVSTRNPTLRTARGLGLGEATVKRVMAEYSKHGRIMPDEPRRPPGPSPTETGNLQPVVRHYVRAMNLAGQRVGVERLRAHLAQEHEVEIARMTLWRCLRRWGYVFGDGKRRSALKERDYVVLARRHYLRQRRANRNPDGTLKRPEVFLDETFVNKNHSSRFTWYLEEDGPWVNKPSGKGQRFILVHAIDSDGWVDGAELIFEGARRTGDYHGEMNWENFSKWFCDQLLPHIPQESIIVLDNARYHNVLAEDAFPTSKHKKDQLRTWLTRNQIPWTEDMLKPELFELCKKLAPASEFWLDKLAETAGHSVLRTPQYHPELQPIETCWAIVKNYMADHCDFTMANFRRCLPEALAQVTGKTCKGLIAKVIKQEDEYWREDEELYGSDAAGDPEEKNRIK